MKKKKALLSRREALALTGASGFLYAFKDPLQLVVDSLVQGMIRKAQATGTPRNYLYIHNLGASPRWHWDLSLNPRAGTIQSHANVKNAFDGSGNPVYQHVQLTSAHVPSITSGETLYMPRLWESEIPTSSGSWVKMYELLNYMLTIRGIDMRGDGHQLMANRQIRPIDSNPSLDGLVADGSSRLLPSVGVSTTGPRAYRSKMGKGQIVMETWWDSNILNSILGSFDRPASELGNTYKTRRQAMDSVIQDALSKLKNYSNSGNPGADSLYTMRNQAESILTAGIGDLSGTYATLYAKYMTLIYKCAQIIDYPILGLTASAIGQSLPATPDNSNRTSFYPYKANDVSGSYYCLKTDYRTLIQHSQASGGYTSAQIPKLAALFAVAEYMFSQGYSSSVGGGFEAISNVYFETVKKLSDGSVDAGAASYRDAMYYTSDEHHGGLIPSMICSAFIYRALSACIYEFIQAMGTSAFSETVIHFTSEFSRIPNDDLGGSQHAPETSTVSLFSGAIQKPTILGNLMMGYKDGYFTNQSTTWGAGATVYVDGAWQKLAIGHAASTVAELLRVESPADNNSSLVQSSTSGVTATIDPPKTEGEGTR